MLVSVAPLKNDKLQVCIPKNIYLLTLKKSSQFDARVTEAFRLKSNQDMAQGSQVVSYHFLIDILPTLTKRDYTARSERMTEC